jgi:large subunit ribosomal protein L1
VISDAAMRTVEGTARSMGIMVEGWTWRNTERNTARAREDRAAEGYPLDEAIKLAVEAKFAKFDETVEMRVRLGVDPRQADQNVRGTVILPHGTGKSVRVLVDRQGREGEGSRRRRADFAGGEELTKKIARRTGSTSTS